jgi:hypothetical protein
MSRKGWPFHTRTGVVCYISNGEILMRCIAPGASKFGAVSGVCHFLAAIICFSFSRFGSKIMGFHGIFFILLLQYLSYKPSSLQNSFIHGRFTCRHRLVQLYSSQSVVSVSSILRGPLRSSSYSSSSACHSVFAISASFSLPCLCHSSRFINPHFDSSVVPHSSQKPQLLILPPGVDTHATDASSRYERSERGRYRKRICIAY